jgi:hypothetical protein
LAVSIASEYDHAEQVVADVALLQDMAEGRLDDERVKQAAQVLLEHKRHELPSVSVAVAARLLGVSRPTVESWREAGVLTSVPVRRRRYEISIESIVRVQALLEELRRLGRSRQVRDDDHPLVVGGQRPPVLAVAGDRGESRGQ